MGRRTLACESTVASVAAALAFSACSTSQTRISENPDVYQRLSHREQSLVSQGKVRIGMSPIAVWLAWGSPDRKIVGNMGRGTIETWVYTYHATYPPCPCYSPLDEYFAAPLGDPFCYSWFPTSVPYPGKLVTFAHGRVVSFQYVSSH